MGPPSWARRAAAPTLKSWLTPSVSSASAWTLRMNWKPSQMSQARPPPARRNGEQGCVTEVQRSNVPSEDPPVPQLLRPLPTVEILLEPGVKLPSSTSGLLCTHVSKPSATPLDDKELHLPAGRGTAAGCDQNHGGSGTMEVPGSS